MRGKKITNKEFNNIKTLISGGLTINRIAETLNRSGEIEVGGWR